jgi:hypothetical protein
VDVVKFIIIQVITTATALGFLLDEREREVRGIERTRHESHCAVYKGFFKVVYISVCKNCNFVF